MMAHAQAAPAAALRRTRMGTEGEPVGAGDELGELGWSSDLSTGEDEPFDPIGSDDSHAANEPWLMPSTDFQQGLAPWEHAPAPLPGSHGSQSVTPCFPQSFTTPLDPLGRPTDWEMRSAANSRPVTVDYATPGDTWAPPRPDALGVAEASQEATLGDILAITADTDAMPAVAVVDPRLARTSGLAGRKGGLCPFCGEHHARVGRFWRKFGYDGPAYCYRCSCAFRAHMLTCKMASDKCTREAPCSRCNKVLAHFSKPYEEVFAAMDRSQPLSRDPYIRPGAKSGGGPEVACPLCSRTNHAGLGLFWQKFGYDGPPYCTLCSASVRNHIMRRRGVRKTCLRERPCLECERVLRHFTGDRTTVYERMDAEHSKSTKQTTLAIGPSQRSNPVRDCETAGHIIDTIDGGSKSKKRHSLLSDLPAQDLAGSWPTRQHKRWKAEGSSTSRVERGAAGLSLGLIGLIMLAMGFRSPDLDAPTPETSRWSHGDSPDASDPATIPSVPPHNIHNEPVRTHRRCDDTVVPTLEDCARADLMTQRFVCRQFLPDHMMATCVGKLGTTCEYVCQNGYTPSGIRRCENWTLTNRAVGSEQQASADKFWGFRGGSCISAPKPTLPPRRPEQAGSTNDSNSNNGTGVSHGQFVFPNVAQVGTDAFGQYITYQLMLTFRPDYVKNVYAIFGTQGDPMRFPAAFHAPDPYGVDIGGTNPLLWGHSPSASLSAYDSWLTVGAVQWWGGETSDHLSTVGIDFETWTATQDLVVSNGAVFWTNPAAGCTQNPTLVAQISTTSQWQATINARGKLAPGIHAQAQAGQYFLDGHYKDEWEVEGIVFSSDMATVMSAPIYGGEA